MQASTNEHEVHFVNLISCVSVFVINKAKKNLGVVFNFGLLLEVFIGNLQVKNQIF